MLLIYRFIKILKFILIILVILKKGKANIEIQVEGKINIRNLINIYKPYEHLTSIYTC